eukprot:364757-Chlamydomonas_euryale.AAC.9
MDGWMCVWNRCNIGRVHAACKPCNNPQTYIGTSQDSLQQPLMSHRFAGWPRSPPTASQRAGCHCSAATAARRRPPAARAAWRTPCEIESSEGDKQAPVERSGRGQRWREERPKAAPGPGPRWAGRGRLSASRLPLAAEFAAF